MVKPASRSGKQNELGHTPLKRGFYAVESVGIALFGIKADYFDARGQSDPVGIEIAYNPVGFYAEGVKRRKTAVRRDYKVGRTDICFFYRCIRINPLCTTY